MKFEKLLIAVGSMILTGAPAAFAQARPAVELEGAVTREQVDGDLNAAMAAYQKIAGEKTAPRDVRARALLHLAGCYEKLGRQAAEVYQKVVREYGDQPAAELARTRLAALKQEAAGGATNLVARKLTTRYFNYQSDGKNVVYRDETTRELIAGDLVGKVKHVLLKPDNWSWWAPSKDYSMVAIGFATKPDRPAYIAVIKTDGTGYRELVRNDEQGRNEGLGFDFVQTLTWSWDNRQLLVAVSDANPRVQLPSGGCLLAVSVSDGRRRRLADVKGGYPLGGRFSPDGRFIAYEVTGPSPRRIFVMPATGGKPSLIHEDRSSRYPGLLDWTADGRYLAITASTAAGPALHLFPIEDGQSGGPPIRVRPGQFYIGSTTPAGALAAWLVQPERYVVHLAPLDADGKPGPWQRLDFGGRTVAQPYVINWSPDSNQIVYQAESDDVGRFGETTIRVRNLTTGQDREIHRNVMRGACLWSRRPSTLICGEVGLDVTKMNVFSISLESGAVKQHVPRSWLPTGHAQVSRDGRAWYVGKVAPAGGALEFARWDIETGQETVLDRYPSVRSSFRLSPDESWLVRSADFKLDVRPTSGGDWKPLVTVQTFGEFAITPDNRWVVYHDVDSAGKHCLFRIPISGGAPERLGDYAGVAGPGGVIEISPDGRKILAGALSTKIREAEFWLLENFVPAAPKR